MGDVDANATPANFDMDYIRVYQQQAAHQFGNTSDAVAKTKNATVELDASGIADLLAETVNNGSKADSGIASLSVTPQQLTCDDTDGANVILSVRSNQGYTDKASATVTALDKTKPEAKTKNITVSLGGKSAVTIAATDIDNGSHDACGIASSSVSPDTFDSPGTTTVTFSVTDNNRNTATTTARVTVEQGNTTDTGSDSKLPAITTPVNNSTLSTASISFNWSANQANVSEWWLFLGSAPRARDLYSSGRLGKSAQGINVNLNKVASQLHASLYYKVAGKWSLAESRYNGETTSDDSGGSAGGGNEDNTDTTDTSAPAITSPVPESKLDRETTTFKWTDNGSNVTTWWLFAGTSAGARDVFNSGRLQGSTTSLKIPAEAISRITHVSLYYKISGKWQRQIFNYQQNSADNGDSGNDNGNGNTEEISSLPSLQSPSIEQTLPTGTTTFSWNNNGFKVSEWWLYAGSYVNGHDIHNSGRLPGSTRSATLNLQGETGKLHITLYYKTAGKWSPRHYVFSRGIKTVSSRVEKADNDTGGDDSTPSGDNSGIPALLNPADGSRFKGSKLTLQWSANGADVTQWWVLLGKVAGGKELFDSGRLAASKTNLDVDMPGGNRTIHVTIHYQINGGWTSSRSRFTSD